MMRRRWLPMRASVHSHQWRSCQCRLLPANILFFEEARGQVEHFARQAEKAINNLGFVARGNNKHDGSVAWQRSGHGAENVRRPL